MGDLLGLFAHVVFVIYLAIGRGLRQWLPLFAYVLPMHVITAAVSTSSDQQRVVFPADLYLVILGRYDVRSGSALAVELFILCSLACMSLLKT